MLVWLSLSFNQTVSFSLFSSDPNSSLLVCGFDSATDCIVYERPSAFIVNASRRQRLVCVGDELCVTAGHDVYASVVDGSGQRSAFKKRKAADLLCTGGSVVMRSATKGMMVGGDNEERSLAANSSEEFALLQLLRRYGFEFWQCSSSSRFDSWVWHLSGFRARAVIEGIFGESRSIVTSSVSRREELVRLLLHAGFSSWYEEVDSYRWVVHLSCDDKVNCSVDTVEYQGRTWCVTMPRGFVVARRVIRQNPNAKYPSVVGKAVISGNCGIGSVADIMKVRNREDQEDQVISVHFPFFFKKKIRSENKEWKNILSRICFVKFCWVLYICTVSG